MNQHRGLSVIYPRFFHLKRMNSWIAFKWEIFYLLLKKFTRIRKRFMLGEGEESDSLCRSVWCYSIWCQVDTEDRLLPCNFQFFLILLRFKRPIRQKSGGWCQSSTRCYIFKLQKQPNIFFWFILFSLLTIHEVEGSAWARFPLDERDDNVHTHEKVHR